VLDVQKIEVKYGEVRVLEDVSLAIREGQIVSVLGANGAGKTTLLRTLSGYLHPVSGKIAFLGVDVTRLESNRMVNLGLVRVPEGRKIFPSLTVIENLELGSYNAKAKLKRKESLENAFSLFPILKERKGQLAGTLSGGEQQMLAMGRGLMSLPKLMMLDEPSLGLSPIFVENIFDIVLQINRRGTTVLLVEQNVHHSLEISEKAYVMENGKIVLDGEGKQLLENDYIKKAYLGI
jgi:branched-chain amino acid transport system ATP-binding protein